MILKNNDRMVFYKCSSMAFVIKLSSCYGSRKEIKHFACIVQKHYQKLSDEIIF